MYPCQDQGDGEVDLESAWVIAGFAGKSGEDVADAGGVALRGVGLRVRLGA